MPRIIRSKAIKYGRNRDLSTYRDDAYVRCARCGFVCHLDRDHRGRNGDRTGYGIAYTKYGGWFDSDADGWFLCDWFDVETEPEVTSGCPQCGTLLYWK